MLLPNMIFLSKPSVLLVLFALNQRPVQSEDPWRFISLADWHGAEVFVKHPVDEQNPSPSTMAKINTFKHIKDNYGGELVLHPGDANGGHWHRREFRDILKASTAEEAVRKGGERCYQGLKYVFKEAGYSKLLMAVGDHEIGDNPWPSESLKTRLLPNFRQIFVDEMNKAANGKFLYRNPIGDALSRPIGSAFRGTSYAHRHKNVLFVTVDVFKTTSNDFFDRRWGLGGEGSVRGTVNSGHLTWFRNVLSEARKDPTIKHIIVQAHLPILQPVRKINSSGMYLDNAENSPFFQAMRDYNVDVYFAGEVHANTATKDPKSNLVQIVSRGNAVENFLTVDITDRKIKITSYNQVGPLASHNDNYEYYGQIIINKSNGDETTFQSKGSLKLLNRWKPMLYFPFDAILSLSARPVLGMRHDDESETLIQRKITVRGIECWDSFTNMGAFGQPYDAQVGHVMLADGVKGKSARFNSTSRVAVYGLGPHTGGLKVSYALFLKSNHSRRNQVLVHFGRIYGVDDFKNQIFTLTLDNGFPALYAAEDVKLVPSDQERMNLADNTWQHIAISMPRNSCFLSQVDMYVNGEKVDTRVEGTDSRLYFVTYGRVSFGGLGHSSATLDEKFRNHHPYEGLIDEVYVWARSLSPAEVATISKIPSSTFTIHNGYRCRGTSPNVFPLGPDRCGQECRKSSSCLGFDVVWKNGAYKCRHFQVRPSRAWKKQGSVCGVRSPT